jgi:hypothetical protein
MFLTFLVPLILALASTAPAPQNPTPAASGKQCSYCCPCPIGMKSW